MCEESKSADDRGVMESEVVRQMQSATTSFTWVRRRGAEASSKNRIGVLPNLPRAGQAGTATIS